jgi:subtilisin family serine protease
MSQLAEYIVTLKDFNDLDEFYTEMESEGGNLYIPNRKVECLRRRAISRNTHYLISAEEASIIKNDPRVKDVELSDFLMNIIKPLYTQTGNFNKNSSNTANHLNWGLLRCLEGLQRSSWGNNAIANQLATISKTSTGRNVDVIIVDGHINPDHVEYQINSDGTGGTRVNQLDWNTLSSYAGLLDNDGEALLTSTYIYAPYTGTDAETDNNHGAHVAGTACGNTLGWARSANIYNISPYSSNPNRTISNLIIWDYIRAFHRNKVINVQTGRKNPTVCNCSFGSSLKFPFTYSTFSTGSITYIWNKGTVYGDGTTALSSANITNGGIYISGGVAEIPYYSTSVAADIADAIADGIHVVAAAGNEYSKIDITTGPDYNNYCFATLSDINYQWYIHRGTTPGAVPRVICVGSVGANSAENKSIFSNCGPRIDVYAPGSNIMSSFNSTSSYGGTNDSRNAVYKLGKISGTSMASPQVAGVLACLLETYPNLTPIQARDFIINSAKINQLTDTGGTQADLTSLQGSVNRFLFAKEERPTVGQTYPKNNFSFRPTTGTTYPRLQRR